MIGRNDGGGVDAITAEGLCLAFQQADILADCLISGDLADYQYRHRGLGRRPALMAAAMLMLEYPRFRARVMRTLTRHPNLFSRMLAAHVGAASPLNTAGTAMTLGWKLLAIGGTS